MKQKMSISIDEELIIMIREKSRDKVFRNMSHVVENALSEWFEKQEVEQDES